MKVTKKHIAYGAVLAVGAVVLLMDQVSGPASADGAAASAAAAALEVSHDSGPRAVDTAGGGKFSENGDEAVIAARLGEVAERRHVEAMACADAFALPAAFRPVETAAATAPVAEKPAAPSPLDVFGKKHKLVSVFVGRNGTAAGAAAQVDERLLKVGDEIDGFRLTAVSQKAVTFDGVGGKVELSFSDASGAPIMTASTSDK